LVADLGLKLFRVSLMVFFLDDDTDGDRPILLTLPSSPVCLSVAEIDILNLISTYLYKVYCETSYSNLY